MSHGCFTAASGPVVDDDRVLSDELTEPGTRGDTTLVVVTASTAQSDLSAATGSGGTARVSVIGVRPFGRAFAVTSDDVGGGGVTGGGVATTGCRTALS
jgi:hypothetical protein